MKILIAEDNTEIALTYKELILGTFSGYEVVMAPDGQEAINQLKKNSFDLVISDYSMPVKNGGQIYQHIKNKKTSTSFILITGEDITKLSEFKNINPDEDTRILNKPVDPQIFLNTINLTLSKNSLPESQKKNMSELSNNYESVEIERFFKLNIAPCDVHLPISSDKWIRILNENDLGFIEVVNKFKAKGVKNLGIRKEDFQKFSNALSRSLTDSIDLEEEISVASKFSLAKDNYLSVQDQLLGIGFNPLLMEQVEKTVNHVLNIYKKDMTISKLLEEIKNSPGGYLYDHSMMTSYIGNLLLKGTKWDSKQSNEKITMGSLFHDVSLKAPKFAEIERASLDPTIDLNDIFTYKEVEDYKKHPQLSVDLIKKITKLPDIFIMILEHHEKPDGSGFPKGLHANRISPMGCVLILAHHFTDKILYRDVTDDLRVEILKEMELIYNKGHFVPLLESLKRSLNLA